MWGIKINNVYVFATSGNTLIVCHHPHYPFKSKYYAEKAAKKLDCDYELVSDKYGGNRYKYMKPHIQIMKDKIIFRHKNRRSVLSFVNEVQDVEFSGSYTWKKEELEWMFNFARKYFNVKGKQNG